MKKILFILSSLFLISCAENIETQCSKYDMVKLSRYSQCTPGKAISTEYRACLKKREKESQSAVCPKQVSFECLQEAKENNCEKYNEVKEPGFWGTLFGQKTGSQIYIEETKRKYQEKQRKSTN